MPPAASVHLLLMFIAVSSCSCWLYAEAEELSLSEKRLHPYAEIGISSLKFERMVKLADKELVRHQLTTATLSKAEALARELFYTPGRILSTQELMKLFEASGCKDQTRAPTPAECEMETYRTADGTCNNLKNTAWGASSTAFRCLLPARYDDDMSTPRGFRQSQYKTDRSPFSSPVPSPRVVIRKILTDQPIEDPEHSHLFMQFGQFVAHDLGFLSGTLPCPKSC